MNINRIVSELSGYFHTFIDSHLAPVPTPASDSNRWLIAKVLLRGLNTYNQRHFLFWDWAIACLLTLAKIPSSMIL